MMPEMRGETSSTRNWSRDRIGVNRALRSVMVSSTRAAVRRSWRNSATQNDRLAVRLRRGHDPKYGIQLSMRLPRRDYCALAFSLW